VKRLVTNTTQLSFLRDGVYIAAGLVAIRATSSPVSLTHRAARGRLLTVNLL